MLYSQLHILNNIPDHNNIVHIIPELNKLSLLAWDRWKKSYQQVDVLCHLSSGPGGN